MTTASHITGHRIDRDDLLARINLTDVLDALTPGEGNGRRRAWRCPEPDHPDEHPSVKVSTDRRGVERWRCWSAGHGGTAIDAVVAARNMSVGDAIGWLNDNYAHLEPLQRPPRPEPRPVGRPAPEVVEYVERCEKLLWSGSGRHIREWLNARGLGDDVLAANRVGADPGRRYLPRPKGLPAGWPAAVYPALDPSGAVAYFQARLIDPPEGRCKYDNPANRWASNPRVAWTQPIPDRVQVSDCVVVTEGIADALVSAQAGYRTVGVLGSTYPDLRVADQISKGATEVRAQRVVVCFDADEAGRRGSARLVDLLNASGIDNVVELAPPAGLDLSEWAMSGNAMAEALRSATMPDPDVAIASPSSLGIEL
jgi:DNA primase